MSSTPEISELNERPRAPGVFLLATPALWPSTNNEGRVHTLLLCTRCHL
uniref:Uncharacterized protein n=1 Tax=Arundo donax TaxID=35708 RepID=A0A0A8YHG9_ARUDO